MNCSFRFHKCFTISSPHVRKSGFQCPEYFNLLLESEILGLEIQNRVQGTATWLAQLGERQSAEREVAGSNPGRTNTHGLKITEKKVLPL